MTVSNIEWDKYSLKINGKRIFILSGEFHYWRAPDRERWRDLLETYKILGLNAVRIYFHWGYHNPAEGKFYFSDNRDVDYLLKLCEELGLFVFIASGPYICAETTAGGFPLWLLAKRDVYIKNLKRTASVKYDPKYMSYAKDWFKHFIPNVKSHQITENPNGCVIGYQIENEYFEKLALFKGNRQYMEDLIKYVREFGITVPTFHNDAWETGSWNNLVDLYGFDKYPVWAPKFPKEKLRPNWNLDNFEKKVDGAEENVRSFGGAAAQSPIFIPELQGGWFNHWGIKYGFDALYDFYGSTYQKMLEQSYAAQGCTMMSIYMLYGGTSWGSVPDCDVYSSYDYSGTIREYGYQPDRLRHLRLFTLFARSFNDSLTCTDLVQEPIITCSTQDVFIRQRNSLDGTEFYFFRNFNRKEKESFKITLQDGTIVPKEGEHKLSARDAFIAVGNYNLNQFHVRFCTLPILVQGKCADGSLLVVYQNGGELLLNGTEFAIEGDIKSSIENGFTRFSFEKEGSGKIKSSDGSKLYVICLSQANALTLNVDFSRSEIQLAWGAYSIFFKNNSELKIEAVGDQTIWLLSSRLTPKGFEVVRNSILPGFKKCTVKSAVKVPEIRLSKWSQCKIDLDQEKGFNPWKEIDIKTQKDPIDHHFTCGHVLYKCEFELPEGSEIKSNLKLKINTRHKAAFWLNDTFIGGHDTYSIKFLAAGAKNGPDPTFLGAKKYNLSNFTKPGKNILFAITENLGHSRIPFVICDIRNPRGILSAKFSKKPLSAKWFIAGIDVTELEQAYNTSGLPEEKLSLQTGESDLWNEIQNPPSVTPEDKIVWYKTSFKWDVPENKRIPLRIHLEGKHNVHIFVNGTYIGKYWGNYGPQHDFYIMDKLLDKENTIVLACWTTEKDNFSVSILPYIIKMNSGNLDENGVAFATEKFEIGI